MELNRNHWFLFGVLFLMLGIQFRLIDSIVVTRPVADMLKDKVDDRPIAQAGFALDSIFPMTRPEPVRTITPPDWLGWAMVSFGAVCTLHALAMRKPD